MKTIPLSKGYVATVDDEDFEFLSQWKWSATVIGRQRKKVYAVRNEGGKAILMHRLLMKPPKGMVVDHINGDGLDNRRANMRVCTQKQNTHNAVGQNKGGSKYKGVSFNPKTGWWRASLGEDIRERHRCEICAAFAYDAMARKEYGEYASLNLTQV